MAVLGVLRNRPAGMAGCHDERGWSWDGVHFRILHPTRWLPYRGNDSSCVLSVTSAAGRVLLPGDISALVERRLAYLATPPFDLVLAPHHGSRSSSSQAFLDWARPRGILVAAGYANRFAFPHEEVLDRYRARQVPAASTGTCGAMRFTLRYDGRWEPASARLERRGFWRWPAAGNCPGNDPAFRMSRENERS
jgi:competence protein ComEC